MPTPEELIAEFDAAQKEYSAVRWDIRTRRREARAAYRRASEEYRRRSTGLGTPEEQATWRAAYDALKAESEDAKKRTRVASRRKRLALNAVLADPAATDILAKKLEENSRKAREFLESDAYRRLRKE
ncbi:MAG TPA: hypothetical protein VGG32_06880 [Thermoplasmata archaeon]|jgi:hypothetical protein